VTLAAALARPEREREKVRDCKRERRRKSDRNTEKERDKGRERERRGERQRKRNIDKERERGREHRERGRGDRIRQTTCEASQRLRCSHPCWVTPPLVGEEFKGGVDSTCQ